MSSGTTNGTSRSTGGGSESNKNNEVINGTPTATSTNKEDHYFEVSFLPIVHDIIHIIEKDNQDASQKNRDSLEASQKVLELAKKIETARAHIYKLPGITHSQEVQMQRLQNLHTQLEMKKDLISKYKDLNMKLGTTVVSEGNNTEPMEATGTVGSGQKQ